MGPRKAIQALTHRKDYLLQRTVNLEEGSNYWHFTRQEIEALNLALALLEQEADRRQLQIAEGLPPTPGVRPPKLVKPWRGPPPKPLNQTGEIT